jgi:hypothetical protein
MTKQIGTPLLVTRAALDRAGADLSHWTILSDQTIRGRRGTMELARPAADRHAWQVAPAAQ